MKLKKSTWRLILIKFWIPQLISIYESRQYGIGSCYDYPEQKIQLRPGPVPFIDWWGHCRLQGRFFGSTSILGLTTHLTTQHSVANLFKMIIIVIYAWCWDVPIHQKHIRAKIFNSNGLKLLAAMNRVNPWCKFVSNYSTLIIVCRICLPKHLHQKIEGIWHSFPISDCEAQSRAIRSSTENPQLWRVVWLDHGSHCGRNWFEK